MQRFDERDRIEAEDRNVQSCWACGDTGQALNDRGIFVPCPVCNWHALRESIDECDDDDGDGVATLRNAMWIGLASIGLIVLGWICW